MTHKERHARHLIAAAVRAKHLEHHDEVLRSGDEQKAAEYTNALLAAHSRLIRVGRAFGERYGQDVAVAVLSRLR